MKKFKALVSFWYSPSPFRAAAGQDNSMDFSGFAAIAALCKHINCQDQCGTVRFVSGVSLQCHTYPAEPGTASAHRQLLPAAKAALQKCWISTGGGMCWVHWEQTPIHHPTGPARSARLASPSLCTLPSVFNKVQHHIRIFYKPAQPTSTVWVLPPLWRLYF